MNGLFLCLDPNREVPVFLPLGLPHGTGPVNLGGVIHDLVHHFSDSELPAAIEPTSYEAELLALGVYAYSLPLPHSAENKDWVRRIEEEVEDLVLNIPRQIISLPYQITVDRMGFGFHCSFDWIIYGYIMAEAKYPTLKGVMEKHRLGMVEGLESHHFEVNQCYLFEPNIETADCEVTWVSPSQLRIEVTQP